MKVTLKRLTIMGCVLVIGFGVYLITFSYYDAVTPLKTAQSLLDMVQATSDSQQIVTDLKTIKTLIPKDGNPVWVFPTDSTDFVLIQKDLDHMLLTVDKVSNVSSDSEEFRSAMEVMHLEASIMYQNLLDAMPFTYVNLSFVFANLMCIVGSMGLAEIFTRK